MAVCKAFTWFCFQAEGIYAVTKIKEWHIDHNTSRVRNDRFKFRFQEAEDLADNILRGERYQSPIVDRNFDFDAISEILSIFFDILHSRNRIPFRQYLIGAQESFYIEYCILQDAVRLKIKAKISPDSNLSTEHRLVFSYRHNCSRGQLSIFVHYGIDLKKALPFRLFSCGYWLRFCSV